MGKKLRLKKERRKERQTTGLEKTSPQKKFFWLIVAQVAVSLSLFTPLIVGKNFYFPFVGPKSLYFMGCVEIAFFSWLILIIKRKEYRPRRNIIAVLLALFLIVLALSSLLGVDFSRSFWSKFERMTGLLMWLHLFAFFLVISSIFKKVSDWKKFFNISIFIAVIISILSVFVYFKVHFLTISDRGGSTLGNTSFLGTYLLFNFFIAVWSFFQSRKPGWKIFYSGGAILMLWATYLSGARAATASIIGGLFLIILLWLSFIPSDKKIRVGGRIILVISSLLVAAALILLFLPGNPVRRAFVHFGGEARILNWQMAGKAFQKRPLLGWGPENYTLAFNEFFNPCFFLGRCGGEIWFDRTHNIIFDNLVTTGVIGSLLYLLIFLGLIFIIAKKYFKEKSVDFWTFSVFPAVAIAYFFQNLTVFDMVASLMMFMVVLGFSASLIRKRGSQTKFPSVQKSLPEKKTARKTGLLTAIIILLFFVSFLKFIVQPLKTDFYTIKTLKVKNPPEKVYFAKKALGESPMGKYQIREFLAQNIQSDIKNNIKEIVKNKKIVEETREELSFLSKELEKSVKESPLDYRTILRLTHIYNVYYLLAGEGKLALAEKYGEMAIRVSPTNQQGYWALAQTRIIQNKPEESFKLLEKAISLEPELFLSYKIGFQLAGVVNDKKEMEKIVRMAGEINPDWKKEFNLP